MFRFFSGLRYRVLMGKIFSTLFSALNMETVSSAETLELEKGRKNIYAKCHLLSVSLQHNKDSSTILTKTNLHTNTNSRVHLQHCQLVIHLQTNEWINYGPLPFGKCNTRPEFEGEDVTDMVMMTNSCLEFYGENCTSFSSWRVMKRRGNE
jgi:hypothetical protein